MQTIKQLETWLPRNPQMEQHAEKMEVQGGKWRIRMNYISLLVNAICLLTRQVNRKKVGIYVFIDRQVHPPTTHHGFACIGY